MKKVVLFFALAVGLLTSASTAMAQVNMSSYITLTVKKDSAIKLDFKAVSDGTPVRIVSGSNTQNITVGTSWYNGNDPSTFTVTAGSTTMTIYGNLTFFSCYANGANLTALDLSKNTQLEWLDCGSNQLTSLDVSKNTQLKTLACDGNNFTTATLDDIYCALPDRTGVEAGKIVPIVNASSSNAATVAATTKSNATSKNWKVQYAAGDDIPATTGSYVCGTPHPEPNMSSYITLTVANGQAIKLDFRAAAAGTPVRIVSGSNTQDITVGTDWTGFANYTAGSTTMTIYGDITRFDCSGNYRNLTALDPSHNTQLTTLYCHGNNLSTQALDDIFCALPVRQASDNARIQPVYNSSSSNHATVLATNAANATAKNWKVQYYKKISDITTTGSYDCSTAVAEAAAEQALTLYPNPVADVLYLSATARTIRIYNIYGIEVAHATDTDRVEVSHLPAGIYTVNADGTVAKMVKR